MGRRPGGVRAPPVPAVGWLGAWRGEAAPPAAPRRRRRGGERGARRAPRHAEPPGVTWLPAAVRTAPAQAPWPRGQRAGAAARRAPPTRGRRGRGLARGAHAARGARGQRPRAPARLQRARYVPQPARSRRKGAGGQSTAAPSLVAQHQPAAAREDESRRVARPRSPGAAASERSTWVACGRTRGRR